MLIFEVSKGGSKLYTRARAYYQRRTKPRLGALLTNQSATTIINTSALAPLHVERLEIFQRSHVAPLATAVMHALESMKPPALAALFQDTRSQHLAELTGEEIELSEREREQNHLLAVSLVALAISGVATLLHSPLILASLPLLSYQYIFVLKNTYAAFQTKEYRWLRSYEAIVMGAELLAGFYLANALAATLYSIAERALVKAEAQSRQSLIEVYGQQPRSAWVLVDSTEYEVPFAQVKVGDVVVVNAGETIPVDGNIIQGSASIDQHILTGEAQPVEKGHGDQVLASTTVLSGKVQIQVERAGNETTVAQIGAILNQTANFKEKVEMRGLALAERFVPPTLALGLVSLPLVGTSRALALFESSFGYNLRLSGPMSLLNLLQIAARHGILIKDGATLEQLPIVDTVVFDKTGTLTLEQPHVGTIYTYTGVSEETVLTWAAAAEYRQTHPIARAILQAARKRDLDLPLIDDTHYRVGYGLQVTLDGHTIRVGSARFMAMEQIALPDAVHQQQALCHDLGYSLVLVSMDQTLVGAIELHPTIRPEARKIVAQLKQHDLNLYIISGDYETPTRHLANSIGIDHYFAEVLPQDKAALVAQLQREGRTVCFVGDGINDAIALQQADLSVSLRGASTAATDTAQIVLMDSSLRHLVDVFDLGREYQSNMGGNLFLATVPSVICIGGVYLLKWGVVTAIMLYNVSLVGSMGNAFLPIIRRQLMSDNTTAKSITAPQDSAVS